MMTTQEDIRDAFIAYAHAGVPVFPLFGIRPDGSCSCPQEYKDRGECTPGKHPAIKGGFKSATANEATIYSWLNSATGPLNIGMPVPEGALVVDIDPRNGGDEGFRALEREHGAVESTRAQRTGSKPAGLHLWFRVPSGIKYPSKLAPGVDTRQLGNYVVVAPSQHASGSEYAWLNPTAEVETAPNWVLGKGWEASEGAAVEVDIGDLPDPLWSDAEHTRTAQLFEEHWELGQRHALAKALGGWLQQRGANAGDIAAVMDQLPSTQPDARLRAALSCYRAGVDGRPNGWAELQAVLGDSADTLAEHVPNHPGGFSSDWWADVLSGIAKPEVALLELGDPDDEFAGLGTPLPAVTEISALPRIVEGLDIIPGMACALIGRPGSAKTPVAMSIALCVANGADWLDRKTKQTEVVYWNFEKSLAANRKRTRMARELGVDPEAVKLMNLGALPVTDAGVRERIIQVARKKPGALFVFDTYGAACFGLDHNSAEYSEPLKILAQGLNDARVASLWLMHCRKGDEPPKLQDVEGHTSLGGTLDGAIGLHRFHEERPDRLTLMPARTVEDDWPSFAVEFASTTSAQDGDDIATQIAAHLDPSWGLSMWLSPDEPSNEGPALSRADQQHEQIGHEIMAHLVSGGGDSLADMCRALPHGPKRVEDALRMLSKLGRVEQYKQGQAHHFRMLTRTEQIGIQ